MVGFSLSKKKREAQTIEIKVAATDEKSKKKVKRAIQKLHGVYTVDVDTQKATVVSSPSVNKYNILAAVRSVGIPADLWVDYSTVAMDKPVSFAPKNKASTTVYNGLRSSPALQRLETPNSQSVPLITQWMASNSLYDFLLEILRRLWNVIQHLISHLMVDIQGIGSARSAENKASAADDGEINDPDTSLEDQIPPFTGPIPRIYDDWVPSPLSRVEAEYGEEAARNFRANQEMIMSATEWFAEDNANGCAIM